MNIQAVSILALYQNVYTDTPINRINKYFAARETFFMGEMKNLPNKVNKRKDAKTINESLSLVKY